jgi:hypothetical protein
MIPTATALTQIPVRSLARPPEEMRGMKSTICFAALVAASLVAGGSVQAASPGCAAPSCAAPACAAVASAGVAGMGDYCDECGDGCGNGRCRGAQYEGLDPYFSCGCNGSYKFPVPPLYTYHWPGLYSAQLMTDYHSPWRFPPLKPYADEVPPIEMGMRASRGQLRPVSASFPVQALPAGEMESMSSKLLRSGR